VEFEESVEFWGRENFVTITYMRAVDLTFFWISKKKRMEKDSGKRLFKPQVQYMLSDAHE
jgi:hypothetical protein